MSIGYDQYKKGLKSFKKLLFMAMLYSELALTDSSVVIDCKVKQPGVVYGLLTLDDTAA